MQNPELYCGNEEFKAYGELESDARRSGTLFMRKDRSNNPDFAPSLLRKTALASTSNEARIRSMAVDWRSP